MNIAIDFDGVICERKGIPTTIDWKDSPVSGSKESIELLLQMGYTVWIFTSNPNLGKIRLWLTRNGFPNLEVTNKKKPANVYIDDRAIRFTNWQDIRKYFV